MPFIAKTAPRAEAPERDGGTAKSPADGRSDDKRVVQPAIQESHVVHHEPHEGQEHPHAHHEGHHEAHDDIHVHEREAHAHAAAHHPLTPEERARRKRLLDRFVYGLATAALVILGVFFRDDLGVLFAPVLGIIILLIVYDIRDLAVRTERLVLLVVLFLLFVSWGLFTLNERTDRVLFWQDHKLGPALEEFAKWSQGRGLIQAGRVEVVPSAEGQVFVIAEPLEWRGLRGPSMEPTIFPGNTVLLRPLAENAALEEGQIVRFTIENRTYVHRIVAVYDDQIVTKGDNSLSTEAVARSDITHVVVGVLYT